MKSTLKLLWHLCAIVGIAGIACAAWLLAQGIGTRQEPSNLETTVARAARHMAIPAGAKSRPNPIARSGDSIRAGLQHWADHCATCHGNDGSGDTTMGRAMYPRVPEMRQPGTQELTDGELFYIIENGVKLTGMPAWSTDSDDGEQDSWHLVNFIRHLPQLTTEELSEMSDLNPRAPDEWRELEEQRKFLSGETEAPPVQQRQQSHEHKGSHP